MSLSKLPALSTDQTRTKSHGTDKYSFLLPVKPYQIVSREWSTDVVTYHRLDKIEKRSTSTYLPEHQSQITVCLLDTMSHDQF